MYKRQLRTINDQIENLAYLLWEERCCPQGTPDEDWYKAEKILLRQSQDSLSNFLNRSQMPFSSIKMGY